MTIIINRGNQAGFDRVPYKRLLSTAMEGILSRASVTSTTVTGFESAQKALQKYFTDFLSSSHPPTLVHLQSALTASEIRSIIPALATLPIVRQDLNLQDRKIQNLTWRKDIAINAISSFLQSFDDFSDRLHCARYGEIPVGNIDIDMAMQLNDVTFGRLLQANKHVLWASPESQPDLGGVDVSQGIGK